MAKKSKGNEILGGRYSCPEVLGEGEKKPFYRVFSVAPEDLEVWLEQIKPWCEEAEYTYPDIGGMLFSGTKVLVFVKDIFRGAEITDEIRKKFASGGRFHVQKFVPEA